MAMLAEPKTKQKWSGDPRNTAWTNDTNRFGYQMLTKMGWESGKGLGAKEDGTTTHVKTAKRRDNLGLGADKSNEDNWLSHQLAFDDLLSHLNDHSENGNEGEKPTKKRKKHEMEKTARQSRKRVFYNRFIQSKDLSSKSAEDMACIFGQRSKSAPGTPEEKSEDEESDDSTASCPAPSFHGVQTITSGQSIQEYFEMKMKEMKAAREGKQIGGEKVEIVKGEVRENGSQDSELAVEELESKKKKKEKVRKRKLATETGELKNDETGSHCVEDQCPAKKKKKNSEEEDRKSGEENECKQETKGRKEKKKKRKEMKFIDLKTSEMNETQREVMENLETKEAAKDGKKKKKKKRKKDKDKTSVDLEMSCENKERNEQKIKLKKARNSGDEKSCKESLTGVMEIKEKEKKRYKKGKDSLSRNVETVEIETKEKERKKKKKKNKS